MGADFTYLNFEITVQKAGENEFLVRAHAGDDEAETRFVLPFNQDQRALIEATLTTVALRSSGKTRSSSAPEVRKMKEVGAVLFEHAVSGPVREFYYKCQGQADQQHIGLRLRLALDPSIGNLPWEFLYLGDEFIALNPRSPVVRYLKGGARVAPLETEHPLRLLVVIASPSDEVPLETTAEKEQITRALSPLVDAGLVEVTIIEGPDTWDRLCDALLRNDTHMLHFVGHGAFDEANGEGVLVMEDSDRRAVRIDSERLRVLVQGKSRLRLVVLNSCLGTAGSDSQPFSSMAAGLVRSGIPAVIAMQFEISDPAAREIAETFYTSIALNLPVDAALTEARRAIFLKNRDSLEWATPILYMQVPDGQLFQLPRVEKPRRGTSTLRPVTTGPLPPPPAETVDLLAVFERSESGQQLPLGRTSINIGRGPENEIEVDDTSVSRKHATLSRTGSTYTIENFGRGGTLVNGKPVTKPQKLKHGDVVRVGNAEWRFRLLSEALDEVKAASEKKRAPVRTATATPPVEEKVESLEARATRCYQDGERLMSAGNWAQAITAFKEAAMYVPDFRDAAAKIAVCETRHRVFALYQQARQQLGLKNYDQAIRALDELAAAAPDFDDVEKIRETAECGQKYQQAIGELQRGNRDRGVQLLREVLSSRFDFEDAQARWQNLAAGGTGLIESGGSSSWGGWFDTGKKLWADKEQWAEKGKGFWDGVIRAGGSAAPPGPHTSAEPPTNPTGPPSGSLVKSEAGDVVAPVPPDAGFAWRVYDWPNPETKKLAEELVACLQAHDCETQVVEKDTTLIVQGRIAGFRRLVGMAPAATVVIEEAGNIKVSIGGGKWLEQGAVMAAGLLLGPALWVTSAVGMVHQKQLLNDLWQLVEKFVTGNGGRQLSTG